MAAKNPSKKTVDDALSALVNDTLTRGISARPNVRVFIANTKSAVFADFAVTGGRKAAQAVALRPTNGWQDADLEQVETYAQDKFVHLTGKAAGNTEPGEE